MGLKSTRVTQDRDLLTTFRMCAEETRTYRTCPEDGKAGRYHFYYLLSVYLPGYLLEPVLTLSIYLASTLCPTQAGAPAKTTPYFPHILATSVGTVIVLG